MALCNIVLHGCLVIEQGYVKVLQDRTKFTATYNILDICAKALCPKKLTTSAYVR